MKKLIFSMLFVALAAIFSANANASCPLGYSSLTYTDEYPGTYCDIQIIYCVGTLTSGHTDIKILSIKFIGDPFTDCIFDIDSDFWDWVHQRTIIGSQAVILYPPCSGVGHSEITTIFEKADCWGSQSVYPNWPSLDGAYAILAPCDLEGGLCRTRYRICYEGSEFVFTIIDSYLVDEGECDYYVPTNIFEPLYNCWSVCGE